MFYLNFLQEGTKHEKKWGDGRSVSTFNHQSTVHPTSKVHQMFPSLKDTYRQGWRQGRAREL